MMGPDKKKLYPLRKNSTKDGFAAITDFLTNSEGEEYNNGTEK